MVVAKAQINLLWLVATLVVNALGAVGLINGLSQGEISAMFPTLITPSPATFSIWSVIYILLFTSLIAMIVKHSEPYYSLATDKITMLFRTSCFLNMAWIVAFSYLQLWLSVAIIFGMVVTLTLLCQELLKISDSKKWLLPLTFGLYTGWLFIATVVNIAAALVQSGWGGFGVADDAWASIILVVAIFLVAAVLVKIRQAAFPLPVAWAYFGIYQALAPAAGAAEVFALLRNIALFGAAALIILAGAEFYRQRIAVAHAMSKRAAQP